MAYTADQLAALEAAIAKGVTKLRMGEEEVTYRSLDEMERIASKVRAGLEGKSRRSIVHPSTKTGWR
jgi:mitochondrial fission protein ELM1